MDRFGGSNPPLYPTSSTVESYRPLADAGADGMGEGDIKCHPLTSGECL